MTKEAKIRVKYSIDKRMVAKDPINPIDSLLLAVLSSYVPRFIRRIQGASIRSELDSADLRPWNVGLEAQILRYKPTK